MELASIEAPDAETDLAALSALVDAYRVFYDQPENLIGATAFVRERLASKDSRFFVVRVPNAGIVAFAHLLTSLDTLALRRIGILEDIYVENDHRKGGIGGALLDAAEAYARERGFSRLTISTAHQNRAAQRLYLAHGYEPDQRFRSFNRYLSAQT
jgi:GNAT superfamily N-acetyltransferase